MVTSGVGGCPDTPKRGELKPVMRLAISVNFTDGAYSDIRWRFTARKNWCRAWRQSTEQDTAPRRVLAEMGFSHCVHTLVTRRAPRCADRGACRWEPPGRTTFWDSERA
jgi:hypothetical protein